MIAHPEMELIDAQVRAQSVNAMPRQISLLDELILHSKERYVSPYSVAKIYAALGDKKQALHWLEKGYEERNPDFIELKVEPALDILRTDERFRDLLRRVGLV